ncbi:hypothetical protein [Pelagimonas varians]|uniref:Uncharacterized protein n=1 Tax=Pelagimonas varians TaxID=696760 RepID=A0A238L7R1_9RHOB|nr:hypothetical protein [Pelagimonas varians]PYG25487.1 hypothetical protein C8N36_13216 [Pelagimonas varians]SMX50346.1 hypothetical protein PEV8663_04603 [Pelagimonas varians]
MPLLDPSTFQTATDAIEAMGHVMAHARCYVYSGDSDSLYPLYEDSGMTRPLANPIIADAEGAFDLCYIMEGTYRMLIYSQEGQFLYEKLEAFVQDTMVPQCIGEFQAVPQLLSDTVMSYDVTRKRQTVTEGRFVTVFGGPYGYQIASADATDHDLITQGGVKLYAVPDNQGFVTFEQLGAVGDGVTDDRAAFVAAAGRKVRGTVGANYWIDIGGTTPDAPFRDTIRLTSGTHWNFSRGGKMSWDYWGAPLLWISENDHDVTLVDPFFEWSGYAEDYTPDNIDYTPAQVFLTADINSFFGASALGRGAACCHMLIQGASDVTIHRPRFQSKLGTARHAIFSCITLRPKSDESSGERLTITNPSFDDFVMGIVGGGINRVRIIGDIYGGRYDDYGALPLGTAPGHLLYLTKVGLQDAQMEHLEIGQIYDRGDYLGTTPGAHGFNTLKLRNVLNFRVGGITSFRPHGVLDGSAMQNGHFGPMHWYADTVSTQSPSSLSNAVFRIAPDAAEAVNSRNLYFEKLVASYGDLPGVTPIIFKGIDSSNLDKNITVASAFIKTTSQNPSGTFEVVQLVSQDSCTIESLSLDLSEATVDTVGVNIGESTKNARLGIRKHRGNFPIRFINTATAGVGNTLLMQDNVAGAESFVGDFNNDQKYQMAQVPITVGGKMANSLNATTHSASFVVPSDGVYSITVVAYRKNRPTQDSIIRTWQVGKWDEADLQWCTPLTEEIRLGSGLSSLSVQCATGQVEVVATTEAVEDVEWYASATRVMMLNGV